ncbi:MAG: ABC transporter permease [Symbiobacteriia bacterium]
MIRKELADLRHQRIFVAIGVLAPFLLFAVFYLIWMADIQEPIEVVNQAGTAGEPFVQAMGEIRMPNGTPYIRVERQDPAALTRDPGSYLVTVEIPASFQQEPRLIVHYGAEQENSVKNYINRIHQAASQYLAGRLGFTPIRLLESPRYPTDIVTIQSMAVMLMTYAFLLSACLFGGVLVAREYEDHTVKLIQVAPSSAALVLLAKGTVALLLTLLAGSVYTAAVYLLTGAAPGHPFLFGGAGLLLAVMGAALGMTVGLLLRRSVPVFLAVLVGNLALWIVSWAAGMMSAFSRLFQTVLGLLPYLHGINLFWQSYFGGKEAFAAAGMQRTLLLLAAALLVLTVAARGTLERGR